MTPSTATTSTTTPDVRIVLAQSHMENGRFYIKFKLKFPVKYFSLFPLLK